MPSRFVSHYKRKGFKLPRPASLVLSNEMHGFLEPFGHFSNAMKHFCVYRDVICTNGVAATSILTLFKCDEAICTLSNAMKHFYVLPERNKGECMFTGMQSVQMEFEKPQVEHFQKKT